MKKLFNLILLVTASLLLLSCEKEKYLGAYPLDNIAFYYKSQPDKRYIPIKQSAQIMSLTAFKDWDKTMYPMELWVDDEEIATISQEGVLTGHKVGEVIVYARVMSTNGPIENSVKYTIGDILTHLDMFDTFLLTSLGVDKNNDEWISASELEQTESFNDEINSNDLLKFTPYLPNLKTASVYTDTTSNSLDLSKLKLRTLKIYDICLYYAISELEHPSDPLNYEKYKPYFLTSLTLNEVYMEHLFLGILPGLPIIDLSNFNNLKTITRYDYENYKWADMCLYLPKNIQEINLKSASIVCDKIFENLHKITLECCPPVIIKKENFPNLKELYYNPTDRNYGYRRYTMLDISDYDISDFENINIKVDTLYLSQSLFDVKHKHNINARKYIIK
jgi:hypothetical protein